MPEIVSTNLSEKTGVAKTPVADGVVMEPGSGVRGDAHAGRNPARQVSLLAIESIERMKAAGAAVAPGAFGENLTTRGVNLPALPIGTLMRCGETLLRVTKIGKTCHTRCAIFEQVGDCVMPREGIFVSVESGGRIRPGDEIQILEETG